MHSQEKVTVELIENGKVTIYQTPKGTNLLQALQSFGIDASFPCGGSGKCGKCKVRLEGGKEEISLEEKKLISEEELKKGWRLACKVVLDKNIRVHKPVRARGANILKFGIGQKNESSGVVSESLGIAIDIGTTTVVLYLADLDSKTILDVEAGLNPQASLGADVITRINYTMNKKDRLAEMNSSIVSCINEMIKIISKRNNLKCEQITKVVVSGNTTMIHFLLDLSVEGLSTYPYTPVLLDMIYKSSKEIGLNINPDSEILILPSASAFIGADIIAGILATGMDKSDKDCILIDLGTNGEMVIGNKERMVACSTAMGPAFEGAGTEFGTASISGAINSVSINENGVFYNTINEQSPTGICGSGIIDIVAEMLNNGIIDNGGKMAGIDDKSEALKFEYLNNRLTTYKGKNAFVVVENTEENPILFTQRDVRQIQLAKAAVATGFDSLLKELGIKAQNVDKIYLAGGFGNFIDIMNAVTIGLIPEVFKDKIVPSGNTSGAGALKVLMEQSVVEDCIEIKEKLSFIDLAALPDFQDSYINNLNFKYLLEEEI